MKDLKLWKILVSSDLKANRTMTDSLLTVQMVNNCSNDQQRRDLREDLIAFFQG